MADLSNPSGTVRVQLDRERHLVFDANTFAAFEEQTKKFFLDVVATLLETLMPLGGTPAAAQINPLTVLRKVSMVDIRALVWAATHEYGTHGVIQWPLTLAQVGRLINLQNLPDILMAVFQGQMEAMPSEQESGESPGPAAIVDEIVGPVVVAPLVDPLTEEGTGGASSGPPAGMTLA